MKPVRFHDAVKAEIADETVYYNGVSKALAERFVKAVEDAVALASGFRQWARATSTALGATTRGDSRSLSSIWWSAAMRSMRLPSLRLHESLATGDHAAATANRLRIAAASEPP